jgi:hypothetical protein
MDPALATIICALITIIGTVERVQGATVDLVVYSFCAS